MWCLQFGLLPHMRWPLTVYEVAFSEVEKSERVITKAVSKLVEIPCCLSTVGCMEKEFWSYND